MQEIIVIAFDCYTQQAEETIERAVMVAPYFRIAREAERHTITVTGYDYGIYTQHGYTCHEYRIRYAGTLLVMEVGSMRLLLVDYEREHLYSFAPLDRLQARQQTEERQAEATAYAQEEEEAER